MIKAVYILLGLLMPFVVLAGEDPVNTDKGEVCGTVYDNEGTPLVQASVYNPTLDRWTVTDLDGHFHLSDLEAGRYELIVRFIGFEDLKLLVEVPIGGEDKVKAVLVPSNIDLATFEFTEQKQNDFGLTYSNAVEGTAIYASKKNEVVVMDDVDGNKSTNNSRQIYAKVAGLNIWENDAAGLQLGIGGRGLSPNRTSNFNTRQNGYDISADALGYPESYYTPPTEGVERIEIIRGAASLQYGTQFGGVVNFIMKKERDKAIAGTVRQTVGSYGLSNTFVSIGGTKKKSSYYAFYQKKFGNGWRENADFDANVAYLSVERLIGAKFKVSAEYTYMDYLAQQAGGLTDKQFYLNPQASTRDRNWFKVNWNLAAVKMTYRFSNRTELTSNTFGLLASRNALGELGRIDRPDPLDERDLISGDFLNVGNETKFLHRYFINDSMPAALLIGGRAYTGKTTSLQGVSTDGNDPTFVYSDAHNLASDYSFNNLNYAAFVENVFFLGNHFSVTPGLRGEYINTGVDGVYNSDVRHPLTDELLRTISEQEQSSSQRMLALMGVGASYKTANGIEVYTNISENYRAINFSDVKIVNPNFRVDENMTDESGFNADLGIRGRVKNYFSFDVTAFFMRYNNRIGAVLKKDEYTSSVYRLRTNVGDAINQGIEAFAQYDIAKAINDTSKYSLTVFTNTAVIDARYITSTDPSIQVGNSVELVPMLNVKNGIAAGYKNVKLSYQMSYVTEQFTDATNAVKPVANAVNGQIPSYLVMDLSVSYSLKQFKFEGGVNNLGDQMYFTRRATGYPGPGIIPSDGRGYYITLQYKF